MEGFFVTPALGWETSKLIRELISDTRPVTFFFCRQRLKLQHQQAIMHQEHATMVKAVGRFMAVRIFSKLWFEINRIFLVATSVCLQ